MVYFSLACETMLNANLVVGDGGHTMSGAHPPKTSILSTKNKTGQIDQTPPHVQKPVSALVRSNDVDADVRMAMRVHLRTDIV